MNLLPFAVALASLQPQPEPSSSPSVGKESVNVTLFYVSYCPYCIEFIKDHLFGTFAKLRENVNLEMVPVADGKDERGQLTCMHGPRECEANKLHACAIYQTCGTGGTLGCPSMQALRALTYIECLIGHPDQKAANNECAHVVHMNPDNLNKCANGHQGEVLLRQYAERADTFQPRIRGFPTIVINDKINPSGIREHLLDYICHLIPGQCK